MATAITARKISAKPMACRTHSVAMSGASRCDVRIPTDSKDRSSCQPYERQHGADQAPEATPHATEDQGNYHANVKPMHRFLRPRPGVLVDTVLYTIHNIGVVQFSSPLS